MGVGPPLATFVAPMTMDKAGTSLAPMTRPSMGTTSEAERGISSRAMYKNKEEVATAAASAREPHRARQPSRAERRHKQAGEVFGDHCWPDHALRGHQIF